MPLDGLTLGFIASELNGALAGGKVERITQPEKDLILLYIHANGKTQKLLLCGSPGLARAHITQNQYVNPQDAPVFCMLLRKHLGGARLESIEQLNGDRVLKFCFSCLNEMGDTVSRSIYLQIMGHHSNLSLVSDENVIIDSARHVTYEMSRVRQSLPGVYYTLPPLQDKAALYSFTPDEMAALLQNVLRNNENITVDKALQQVIRGLSSAAACEFAFRLTSLTHAKLCEQELSSFAKRLHAFVLKLSELQESYVLMDDDGNIKDLLPFRYLSLPENRQIRVHSLSEANDRCFTGIDRADRMRQRTLSMKKTIRSLHEKAEKKLLLQQEEAQNGENSQHLRIFGELLNAQLYLVPKGVTLVTLPDLYSMEGGTVDIPLDKTLSPVQNAQKYFKRYRKARAAMVMAREQAVKTENELRILEAAEDDLERCENEDELNDIRHVLAEAGLVKAQPAHGEKQKKNGKQTKPKQKITQPLSFSSPNGFTIQVGKNCLQNERLTLSARPGDVWLHAKDVPGSHVILKRMHPDGNVALQDEDILYAAKLAAFYSQGKGRGVQVDYTDRRFVKKVAGTPTGFVTYSNQKCLLIHVTQPELFPQFTEQKTNI